MQLEHLSIDGRRKLPLLPLLGFHALLGRWLRWALLAVLALGWQAAMATPPALPPMPEIVVDVPDPQPGIPVDEFEMKFSFIRLENGLHGKIKFKVVGANHQDLTGIEVPAELPLDSPGPTAEAKFRPKFLKEGWYRISANFESNTFNSKIQFSILLYQGRIYYEWIGGRLLSSMVRANLQDNVEYKKIVSKVNRKQAQWEKNHTEKSYDNPFEKWLTKEELDRLADIVSQERKRLYKAIYLNSNKWKKKTEAQPKKISKGDIIPIKAEFAIDYNFSKFLPLRGAVVRVLYNGLPPPGFKDPIAYGSLDENGEFNFTSPVDNLKYQVQLQGRHDKFNIEIFESNDNFTPLKANFDQANEIRIVPNADHENDIFDISEEVANSWSVFQALYELTEHVKPIAGIPEAPVFRKVITNRPNQREAFHRAGIEGGKKVSEIHLGIFTSFDWDVIAHEYGHAVAYLQGAIRAEGGSHDGSNQYDIEKNPSGEALNTYRNKELSNALALNEAYATWFALNFWKERRYSNETPWLGDHQLDQTYRADRPGIPMDLESNTKSYGPIKNIFGEDSEISVGRLLWDITDENNEPNQRALCEKYCQDAITVPFASVSASAIYPGGARGTAPLSSISDFHEHFYKSYVGKPVGDLDKEGPVNPQELERALQVGALFAEHGMAVSISKTYSPHAFKELDKPVTLIWKQLKTGTMPGLDKFEVLFYAQKLDRLLMKLDAGALNPLSESPNVYQWEMPKEKVAVLHRELEKHEGQKNEYKFAIVVKGTATGAQAAAGKMETGPYYGNAEIFTISPSPRYSVIAVDSSGSNGWTDPANLRILAANGMVQDMALVNEKAALLGLRQHMVAAVDFDDSIQLLADFTLAQELAPKDIFNAIDSWGGTHIADAIIYSTQILVEKRPVPPQPFSYDENTPRIYLLSDLDDERGFLGVASAIRQATASNVIVNLGHLLPLAVKTAHTATGDWRGERRRLQKLAEPLDPVIEALLAGGGSYAVLENAQAQQAWRRLMAQLSATPPWGRTSVNLPLDVRLYGYARAGVAEPVYLFAAPASGRVRVVVDGKGHFVPALAVDGAGAQVGLGQDQYALEFDVTAGQTYRITLNKPISAQGLYSIVLRQTVTRPAPPAPAGQVTPVPASHPLALGALGALVLCAARRRMKGRR